MTDKPGANRPSLQSMLPPSNTWRGMRPIHKRVYPQCTMRNLGNLREHGAQRHVVASPQHKHRRRGQHASQAARCTPTHDASREQHAWAVRVVSIEKASPAVVASAKYASTHVTSRSRRPISMIACVAPCMRKQVSVCCGRSGATTHTHKCPLASRTPNKLSHYRSMAHGACQHDTCCPVVGVRKPLWPPDGR